MKKVILLRGQNQIDSLENGSLHINIERIKSHLIVLTDITKKQLEVIKLGLNLSSDDYKNLKEEEIYKGLSNEDNKLLLSKIALLCYSYTDSKILSEDEINLINNFEGGDKFDIDNIYIDEKSKEFWRKVDSGTPVVIDARETNFIDNTSQEYKDAAKQCSIDNPDDCEMCGS